MAEHTPGPWRADLEARNYRSDGWYQAAISTGSPDRYRVVAEVRAIGDEDTVAEAHATARLIAAAPDLLASLESALWLLDRMAEWTEDYPAMTDFARDLYRKHWREVIEKATGEVA